MSAPPDHVHVGFEVGSGRAVDAPIRHMVVTGQTQEAGKTTTLEALIARSQRSAIAFVTKRGEQSFGGARRMAPYFRERADWQFVASIIEATMREKMRFERPWIIRACKGARSLSDVHARVQQLEEESRPGMQKDIYMLLDTYLQIVVPRIVEIEWATKVALEPGLNVVDCSDRESFPSELQALVMRSVLEWVYERETQTITIIPEAWEFVPQDRGGPVKLAAIELIRKGAGLKNYVWLDTQDIGGVDKEILRSCPVWLLGVQRETNEIERTLKNIPAGLAKPSAAEIALLKKGEFFVCYGEHVTKTYVWPAWMPRAEAEAIARGSKPVQLAASKPAAAPEPAAPPKKSAQARAFAGPPPADVDDLVRRERRAGYEEGLRDGITKGHAVAMSGISSKVLQIVNRGDEFLAGLREAAEQLAAFHTRGAVIMADVAGLSAEKLAAEPGRVVPIDTPELARMIRSANGAARETPAREMPAGRPELNTLRALVAQHPRALSLKDWAIVAGMRRGGGGWNKHLRRLRERDFVFEVSAGLYQATAAGLAEVGGAPKAATPAELLEHWQRKLGGKSKSMLARLIDAHPRALSIDELAAAVGMKPRTGRFNDYMKHLRANGLVIAAGRKYTAAPGLVS